MKRSIPLAAAMVFFASAVCSAAGEWGAHLAALETAADQGHEYAGKLLTYVHQQRDTQMPSCLLPDPPVALARGDSVDARGSSAEDGETAGGGSENGQLGGRPPAPRARRR